VTSIIPEPERSRMSCDRVGIHSGEEVTRMADGDLRRWLYNGRRPNGIARFLNWATVAIGSAGIALKGLSTLEVVGRKSGRVIALPVAPSVVDGQRYLVSMLGDDVAWVLNVRAAGGRAVLHHGSREPIRLEEVPADQRAPILKDYLNRAPGARPHIPVGKDAPLSDFAKIAAGFPVFRVITDVGRGPD
jgi:hypothetical protein